jgi:hypothetical protein
MGWLRGWTNRRQFRRRRAYFRPTDRSDLDAALVPSIDHIVIVRFTRLADGGSPLAGHRLYRILGHQRSRRFARPERDFDFLE